jgi:hypothetical protein
MKTRLFGFCDLVACMALLGVPPAAATTYSVSDNVGSITITGSITTDGNTGLLDLGDIKSWNFDISGLSIPFAMTSSTGLATMLGSDLIATSTTLSYKFSDLSLGELVFGSGGCYPCASLSYDTAGALIASEGGLLFDIDITNDNSVDMLSNRSGTLVIASVAQTPLPAALPLFSVGLGIIALVGRRRRRRQTFAGPRRV